MVKQNEKEENIEWVCPYCRQRYRAPRTAGISSRCMTCGKEWYTSGIDVENRESLKLIEEFRKRRKREIEADRERE